MSAASPRRARRRNTRSSSPTSRRNGARSSATSASRRAASPVRAAAPGGRARLGASVRLRRRARRPCIPEAEPRARGARGVRAGRSQGRAGIAGDADVLPLARLRPRAATHPGVLAGGRPRPREGIDGAGDSRALPPHRHGNAARRAEGANGGKNRRARRKQRSPLRLLPHRAGRAADRVARHRDRGDRHARARGADRAPRFADRARRLLLRHRRRRQPRKGTNAVLAGPQPAGVGRARPGLARRDRANRGPVASDRESPARGAGDGDRGGDHRGRQPGLQGHPPDVDHGGGAVGGVLSSQYPRVGRPHLHGPGQLGGRLALRVLRKGSGSADAIRSRRQVRGLLPARRSPVAHNAATVLIDFFLKLKSHKLPVSIKEYLTLLEAMDRKVIEPSIDQFYYLSRAALVKDEANYDKFDRAFGEFWNGVETIPGIDAQIPLEWLLKQVELTLSEEEKKQIEALGGWEKLMETLRQRLEEQKGRHQGGNKWVGTGGTSPFGAYGYNPEGVRIGQDKPRHHPAVKVWDQREYPNLDDWVKLGTRNIKVALRRRRRFAREW